MVQRTESDYNVLRKTMPSMIRGSQPLIEGLESQKMCNWLVDDDQIKMYSYITTNKTELIS